MSALNPMSACTQFLHNFLLLATHTQGLNVIDFKFYVFSVFCTMNQTNGFNVINLKLSTPEESQKVNFSVKTNIKRPHLNGGQCIHKRTKIYYALKNKNIKSLYRF